MCHVDSERNCGTWGVGWLHFSILALPSFSSTFCKELWTLCIGLCFFENIFTLLFKHFLQGIIGLRCSMVTFVYLSFTFFFEHFLQGTMDLRHRLITSPCTKTPQKQIKQFTNCLRTFNSFYIPPPIRRVRGEGRRGVRGDVSLTDLQPPLNVNLRGTVFDVGGV